MFAEPKFEHSKKREEYALQDLTNFLYHDLYSRCFETILQFEVSYAKTDEPVPFQDRLSLHYIPIREGEQWSFKNFECAWMHLKTSLPANISLENLDLDFDDGGEALLVDEDGSAVKGFSFGSDCFGEYNFPSFIDFNR